MSKLSNILTSRFALTVLILGLRAAFLPAALQAQPKKSPAKGRTVVLHGHVRDQGGKPLPYALILVKKRGLASESDSTGRYSLRMQAGDTAEFIYIGHEPAFYPLAKTYAKDSALYNATLERDTVMFVIRDTAWYRTRAEFRKDFMHEKGYVDTFEALAKYNLSTEKLAEGRAILQPDAQEVAMASLRKQVSAQHGMGAGLQPSYTFAIMTFGVPIFLPPVAPQRRSKEEILKPKIILIPASGPGSH